MRVAGPKEIWTAEAAPAPQTVTVGALVQLFVKREGFSGFDSVFAKVEKVSGKRCEGIVVDGPTGTRGENLLFDAVNVFDVL